MYDFKGSCSLWLTANIIKPGDSLMLFCVCELHVFSENLNYAL